MEVALFLTLICVLAPVRAQFDIQFIGDNLTQKEVTENNFCETKYCLQDAQILFTATTQNKSVSLCDDFKEFSVGTFNKYNVIDERKGAAGFFDDIYTKASYKYYKSKKSSTTNDTRIVKTVKKLFSQCIDQKFLRRNGMQEFREYLLDVLGVTIYPDSDQSRFNLTKALESDTSSFKFLLGINLERCNDDMLCIDDLFTHEFNDNELALFPPDFNPQEIGLYIRPTLYDINEAWLLNSTSSAKFYDELENIIQNLEEFGVQISPSVTSDPMTISVDELKDLMPSLDVDWVKVINLNLLTKIDGSSKIQIKNPELFRKRAEILSAADQKKVADFLAYLSLIRYQVIFVNYSSYYLAQKYRPHAKSEQRWKQCDEFFVTTTPLLDDFMYHQLYYDENYEKSFKGFVRELLDFFGKNIFNEINLENTKFKDDLAKNLSSLNYATGVPERYRSSEEIEEYYKDLKLDKSYVQNMIELLVYDAKMALEPWNSERKQIDKAIKYLYYFYPERNTFYISSYNVQYPIYHPERPRFFNTAINGFQVYYSLIGNLHDIAKSYNLSEKDIATLNSTSFNSTDASRSRSAITMTYDFYVSWEKAGNKDLQLGATRLNGRQLFWVALARVLIYKTHSEKIQLDVLNNFYFIRTEKGFMEDFGCGDVDENYYENLVKLLKQSFKQVEKT